ncbi:MAG: YidC/Oxa1 family membrane protein insertase [Oscillospiraceae bacterium]|nr:YidC/Oxa1 family membrane protein insertase [Oscillospiraceae bacterium]
MFNLIAIPFGWLMRLIYQVVNSYGIALILFTVFMKLLALPSNYKTQVNSARIAMLSPKIEKLKKSFANNPQRMQEEQNRLYQEEGINPSAGCLSNLVMMVVLMGVYQVVMRPITHILNMSAQASEAVKLLSTWLTENQITEKYLNTRPELIILKYAKTNPEIFASISDGEFLSALQGFENTFFGFDLGAQPSLSPAVWNSTAVLLAMIPILSGVLQLVLTIITQHHNKKANPSMQGMGAMNIMLYTMPLMSVWIGFAVPAGVGFYWLINSLLSLITTLGLYAYLNPKRMVRINEKEKKKQLAKGPTWTQRMMEASAQYANEQNGGNGTQGGGNRTRSADGDDGMSRKERAEYERKLIEAARKRAAEKYGETLSDDDNDE